MDPKQRFLRRIRQNYQKLSPKDRRIADYLVNAYPNSLLETAAEIGEKLSISVSTVSRFFPKVGFGSIKKAQRDLRSNIDYLKNSPLDRFNQKKELAGSDGSLFDRTRKLDIANIEETFQGITAEELAAAAAMLSRDDNTIYVVGGRKFTGVAHYTIVQLNALHPRVVEVRTDPSMVADAIVDVSAGDVLLLYDFRRYFKIGPRLAAVFRETGASVIVISDSPVSPCSELADVLLLVKTRGVSIFDSYTATYFLVNALLAEVTENVGDRVKQKYEKLEKLYKRFESFYGA